MTRRWGVVFLLAWALGGCSDADPGTASPQSGSTSGSGAAGTGTGGRGGDAGSGGSAQGGGGDAALEQLLQALRADPAAATLAQSKASGWPAPVSDGHLFVSLDPAFDKVAGDHDDWQGTAMNADAGFAWLVLPVPPASRYKFSDGNAFVADPWSRAYAHDDFGIMSRLGGDDAHLERHFDIAGLGLQPRTLRVWIPAEQASHVLYMHDGQNLFDPLAPWGGWQLQDSVPPAMMLAALDNTSARFDEYTHVADDIGSGSIGGQGDAYVDLLQQEVRTTIAQHYGEPLVVGTMGSSLGGLIALHAAARQPGKWDFVASLSGTLGWGSIGLTNGQQNETMIERYAALGHTSTAIYIDSGGNGQCYDSDADGIEDDDPSANDNYCENRQMEAQLVALGYSYDVDFWHYHEPGAPHSEAAWATRVWRPLQAFATQ